MVVLASIVAVMVSQAGLSNARSAALHSVTEDELRELGDDVLEEMERFLRESEKFTQFNNNNTINVILDEHVVKLKHTLHYSNSLYFGTLFFSVNSTEENSTMTTPTTTQTPDTAASPTEDSCEEDAPVTESTGQADDGDCSCETEFSDEQEVTIREREEYSVAFYVDTSEPVSNCTKRTLSLYCAFTLCTVSTNV